MQENITKLNSIDKASVSIIRARRILGSYYKDFSDNQIIDILTTLKLLAREHLGYNGSKKA
jgi:hypothetical protein